MCSPYWYLHLSARTGAIGTSLAVIKPSQSKMKPLFVRRHATAVTKPRISFLAANRVVYFSQGDKLGEVSERKLCLYELTSLYAVAMFSDRSRKLFNIRLTDPRLSFAVACPELELSLRISTVVSSLLSAESWVLIQLVTCASTWALCEPI